MHRFIARFLITSLTPRSLVRLGELLIAAGNAATERQSRIEKAILAVRDGVNALTEK